VALGRGKALCVSARARHTAAYTRTVDRLVCVLMLARLAVRRYDSWTLRSPSEACLKFEPRILVVEDDPVVAELFRELLPMQGYRADFVADAEAALALLMEQTYDLVISDKNLPRFSGLELLKVVKQSRPDLDVIIMTAYADMQSVLSALEQGVYDYLVKPFESIDDVLAKIHRALEKRRIVLENKRFLEYLTQANAQIEAMNRELEAKVDERTRELASANERLQELTFTDDVTGLYNQRYLFNRLDEEFRRARRHKDELAVMMIDIDHFKNVNDTHDHLFGSRVLKRLGECLKQAVRSIDQVVRYGGDEFCVVLPSTKLMDAVQIAERVRSHIEASDVGDHEDTCHVTISIGVAALVESNADSPRALLRAADKALYLAKSSGRNRIAIMDGARVTTAVAGIR
jgi:two-component system, cell cycle response regulator